MGGEGGKDQSYHLVSNISIKKQVCGKLMREKTPLLDDFVCFQIGIKTFWLEVFYYFSEKFSLSQNICYFRESFSPNVMYYQQLSHARYQVRF